jgi:hypothetical protein
VVAAIGFEINAISAAMNSAILLVAVVTSLVSPAIFTKMAKDFCKTDPTCKEYGEVETIQSYEKVRKKEELVVTAEVELATIGLPAEEDDDDDDDERGTGWDDEDLVVDDDDKKDDEKKKERNGEEKPPMTAIPGEGAKVVDDEKKCD